MVKDLGDIHNLDPDRYMKLNVYSRENARVVFRDYELLLTAYETKICKKIFAYKYSKIFEHDDAKEEDAQKNVVRKSTSRAKSLALAEQQSSAQETAKKPQPQDLDEDRSQSDEEDRKPKGKLGRLKAFYANKKKEMKNKKDKKLAGQKSEQTATDATTVDSSVKNTAQHENIASLPKQASTIIKTKNKKKLEKEKELRKQKEIQKIMQLPEVRNDLLRKSNPMNFDLYKCVFTEGGELAFYAERIRERLLQMNAEVAAQAYHAHAELLKDVMLTQRSTSARRARHGHGTARAAAKRRQSVSARRRDRPTAQPAVKGPADIRE